MPGVNGIPLCDEIRKLPNAMMLPIVITCPVGKACGSSKSAGGTTGCLSKPIKPSQFHDALMRVISGAAPAAEKKPVVVKLDPKLSERLPLRVLLCDDIAINQMVATRRGRRGGGRPGRAGGGGGAGEAGERK